MIRLLEGSVRQVNAQNLTLMVRGVGYLVYTNTARQNIIEGQALTLHTHLAVRETALDIYGFIDPEELQFFELLLSVPKIGPKSALQVLLQADVSLLVAAIIKQDSGHLHKLSGIGKKTAANIVSHLENKVTALLHTASSKPDGSNSNLNLTAAQTDAIDALEAIGFDAKEVRGLILKLPAEADAKTLIQAVLKK